jgi:hypothetical protein
MICMNVDRHPLPVKQQRFAPLGRHVILSHVLDIG